MSTESPGPFEHVPRSVGGHFVINLYAAIYRLLHQTRRFAELSESSLEEVFQRFPFLGEYFNEMRQHMPEDISWEEATEWWKKESTRWDVNAPCTCRYGRWRNRRCWASPAASPLC